MNNLTLNVLYAADNNYAPFLGVSMFSLFKNNADIVNIHVYAVLDNVSEENKEKLMQVATQFRRRLKIIDAASFNERLKQLNIPTYRGNYTTNYRLFFNEIIDNDVERLFYIDSDTVITASLKSVLEVDFLNFPAAVVLDSLGSKYKGIIGFDKNEPYFNAGILIIDVRNWIKQNITESMLNHIQNVRSQYCNPDQDLLNVCLKGKIKLLPPEYNFQPFHRAYSDKIYGKVYGFENYYTKEQLENARKNPVILHAYRFLGEFPWHKGNQHPDTKIFDEYLSQTLWADYKKQPSKNDSLIFKIERILYRVLPKILFLRLFAFLQYFSFKKQNERLLMPEC